MKKNRNIRKTTLAGLLILLLTVSLGMSALASEVPLDTDAGDAAVQTEQADEEVLLSGETASEAEVLPAEVLPGEAEEGASVYILEDTSLDLEEFEAPSGDAYDFTNEESRIELLEETKDLPAAYSLKDEGYITPIKLQNPFGSCWAFAAIAAAESSILSSGLAAEDHLVANNPGEGEEVLNLSEKQLSYFTSTPIKDPKNPQNGEGKIDNGVPSSEKLNTGGYSYLASSVFASGVGPSLESADPEFEYKGKDGNIDARFFGGKLQAFSYSATDDWNIDNAKRFDRQYSLKEAYVLPAPAQSTEDHQYIYDEAATAAIKKQIYEGRAVEIGFLADQSSPNQDDTEPLFLSPNWAHYGNAFGFANHAVTIVGWDDNYPVENFNEKLPPPAEGAWLVKNSWGSGEEAFPNHGEGNWGIPVQKTDEDGNPVYDEEGNPIMVGSGYFWLSYYDQTISFPEALEFEKEDGLIMDAYDYMPAQELNAKEYTDEARMANAFYASQNQKVKQISFQTTHPDTTVSWEIYLLQSYDSIPTNGLKVASGSQEFEFGGFHKVDLEEPVTVLAGQIYVIVITETVQTDDGQTLYTVCVPVASRSDTVGVINYEESLAFFGETWNDLADESSQAEIIGETALVQRVCDNFSIKGYAEPIEDMKFSVSFSFMSSYIRYALKEHMKVKLRVTTYNGVVPDLRVEWRLDDDSLFTVTPSEDGFSAVVKAKQNEEYPEGMAHLCAELYDRNTNEYLGTQECKFYLTRPIFDGATITEPGVDFIHPIMEYTGNPLTPAIVVEDFDGDIFVEGRDYDLEYLDNVKCGIAAAHVSSKGATDPEAQCDAFYAIVPVKPEITKVEAGACQMSVTVKDQSGCGMDGYQVEYRKKGAADWTAAQFPADKNTFVIKSLEEGAQYEVRVCGYISIPEPNIYYFIFDGIEYGAYSDVAASAAIKPAVKPKALKMNRTSAEMETSTKGKKDSTLQLAVTFDPPDTTNQQVIWKSSNEAVAAVDAKGVVTALTYGKATITAASKANPEVTAECVIQTRFNDAYYQLDGNKSASNVNKETADAISWAADKKITGEKIAFGTKDSMSRGQFVRFLYRYAGNPKVTGKMIRKYGSKFKDVDKNYTHYKAIVWAVSKGLIAGYSDGSFKPNKTLARQDVATILWKYAGSPKVKKPNKPFSDVAKSVAVAWGKSKKIFTGTKFRPKANCLRGDFALFLYRYDKVK